MTTFEIPSGIEVWPGDGWPILSAGAAKELQPIPVDLAPRVAAPRTFHVTIDHPAEGWIIQLMFLIEEGEILFASAWASGDELHTLLARVLKIQPLRAWQKLAFDHVSGHQFETDRESFYSAAVEEAEARGSDDPERDAGLDLEAWAAAERRSPAQGKRRNRITPALLEEVAQVYREAWESGAPPTAAVAEHFGRPHSTAANWVVRARRDRFLGPAYGKQGGEVEQ